ncbi:hypothetical protein CLONEX_03330 [[Clostridium] nexile DSM 1787]|nr:hypothetical protein CLONEX_03330 [[Clostridium] nexile DSM 1787]
MYYNRLGGENYASKRRITGMPSCNSSISHRRKMEIIINQL